MAATVVRPAPLPRELSQPFYRPELDALRFLAFVGVFICHTLPVSSSVYESAGVPRIVGEFAGAVSKAGSFGVNLFFLLSAFLITALLVREQTQTGSLNVRRFYFRRILRIWPLYFFALAIAAIAPIGHGRMPLIYVAGYALLAGNWMNVFLGPPPSFMSVLWSVSVEEQFYLSWPLVVRKVRRRGIIAAAAILLVIANATRAYLATQPVHDYSIWPNTFAQLDCIALGILIAACAIRVERLSARALCAISGLCLLIYCGHAYSIQPLFTLLGYPAVAIGCALLFLAVYGLELRSPGLIYLGKISYGLYVYHIMALSVSAAILHGRTSRPLWLLLHWTTGFALTVLFASISYRWLESPFLRLKERYAIIKSRPV